jgi:lysophospholipase L1-like esterase
MATSRVSPAAPPANALQTIRIAVAGDSTTSQPESWRADLSARFRYRFVGGYVHYGYTSKQILARIVDAGADVLVVMVGVNDLRTGVPIATVLSNIRSIVARTHARHVIISAIVPSDIVDYGSHHLNRKLTGAELNAQLPAFAASHSWTFVDPDAAFRLADNGYAPGTTVEGVHPTQAAYQLEAHMLAMAIEAEMAPAVRRDRN